MQKEISINICGDFYLNTLRANDNYFPGDILEIFHKSDFNIVNLESPVPNIKEGKIKKTGPHLYGSSHTFSYLKQLNVHLITLANNHLMDFGQQGLSDTLNGCKNNSINYVGAGMSLDDAKVPYFLEKDNTRIAVLNFTENEWSVARFGKAGANPLDIVENVREIRKAREMSDFVLLIIHGGNEFYNLPNPRMVSQYRFFAENGASAIIGHHPHCISGYEIHNGVPVFYSLGNFLFTMRSSRESWYTGLILNLRINKKDEKIRWELIPVRQMKDIFTLSILSGIERQNILSDIDKFSQIISDEALLAERWECFVRQWSNEKLDMFSPLQLFTNKHMIRLIQKLGLNRFFRTKKHYAQILNHMRCESLSDLSKSVIEMFLEK